MHSPASLLLAVLALLAGRVLALNISVGGFLGVIPASEFLNTTVQPFTSDCSSQCAPGIAAIKSCGDTDDACLCNSTTVAAVLACEQCFFTDFIRLNEIPVDPRMDATPALTAYTTACNASTGVAIPATAVALTLPADWDGPFGQGLSTAGTVVVVGVATLLGTGLITVLNTM